MTREQLLDRLGGRPVGVVLVQPGDDVMSMMAVAKQPGSMPGLSRPRVAGRAGHGRDRRRGLRPSPPEVLSADGLGPRHSGQEFEPPAARTPTGSSSFDSQPAQAAGGRHFVSHPVRDPVTLRTERRVHLKSHAGTSGAGFNRARSSRAGGRPFLPGTFETLGR
jgi:hypothetical protein